MSHLRLMLAVVLMAIFAPAALVQAAEAPTADCSVLSHTDFLCVRNVSRAPITGLSCIGMWGESFLSVPGGAIPSGGLAIVKTVSKCEKTIKAYLRDNAPIEIKGFDVRTNTQLNVTN